MVKNDTKIKALLKVIDKKKKELGSQPSAVYKTNCIIKYDQDVFNLNVVDIPVVIYLYSKLINLTENITTACAELDLKVEKTPMLCGYPIETWKEDLKVRASILKWKNSNEEIKKLEKSLKDLRSEESKTADELEEIMAKLS